MGRAVAFVMLLLAAPLAGQNRFHLRNTFRAGATNWIEQTQEIVQTVQLNGKPVEGRRLTSVWMERRIVDVKDGVASIEQYVARVKVKSSGSLLEEEVDYDSDVAGSNPRAFRDIAAMVRKTIKARVDTSGKVLDFELPLNLDGPPPVPTRDGLEHWFRLSFTPLPADAIAIGETWGSELDFPIVGKAKAGVTHKLLAVGDQRVTVEQKMAMDTSALKLPKGTTIEVSKAEGMSVFDLRPPVPIEVTALVDMKMAGGRLPAIEIQMRTSLKRVDGPPPKPVIAPKTGG